MDNFNTKTAWKGRKLRTCKSTLILGIGIILSVVFFFFTLSNSIKINTHQMSSVPKGNATIDQNSTNYQKSKRQFSHSHVRSQMTYYLQGTQDKEGVQLKASDTNHGKSIINIRNFLVNKVCKLIYCWIHKVASTTFTALFSSLAGRNVKEKYYREIKFLSMKNLQEFEEVMNNKSFTKLIVVRHPFHRLVSAFRDRIQDNSHFSLQAWKYGPQILAKRKLNRTEIFDNKRNILKTVPTFQEFVTWLISTSPSTYDVHWIRYQDHCVTDSISYDIIIKLESLLQNENLFFHMDGLNKSRQFFKHLQKSRGGETTFERTCEYFKDLYADQIKALYKIYETDFISFNYSPNAYYKCAKQK